MWLCQRSRSTFGAGPSVVRGEFDSEQVAHLAIEIRKLPAISSSARTEGEALGVLLIGNSA
jgi:hypothetical protein